MTDYRVQVYAGNNLAWEGTISAVSTADEAAAEAKAELPYGDVANYRAAVKPVEGTETPEPEPEPEVTEPPAPVIDPVPVPEPAEPTAAEKAEEYLKNLPADVVEYLKSLGK